MTMESKFNAVFIPIACFAVISAKSRQNYGNYIELPPNSMRKICFFAWFLQKVLYLCTKERSWFADHHHTYNFI